MYLEGNLHLVLVKSSLNICLRLMYFNTNYLVQDFFDMFVVVLVGQEVP
jgi:hypothetical protein